MTDQLIFQISRDAKAMVIVTGDVTQESIELLIKLLELQKDTFPTKSESLNKIDNPISVEKSK